MRAEIAPRSVADTCLEIHRRDTSPRSLSRRETQRNVGSPLLDAVSEFDHTFWLGDLNYRIDLAIPARAALARASLIQVRPDCVGGGGDNDDVHARTCFLHVLSFTHALYTYYRRRRRRRLSNLSTSCSGGSPERPTAHSASPQSAASTAPNPPSLRRPHPMCSSSGRRSSVRRSPTRTRSRSISAICRAAARANGRHPTSRCRRCRCAQRRKSRRRGSIDGAWMMLHVHPWARITCVGHHTAISERPRVCAGGDHRGAFDTSWCVDAIAAELRSTEQPR